MGHATKLRAVKGDATVSPLSDEDLAFSEPLPSERVLTCDGCLALRIHRLIKTAYRRFFFTDPYGKRVNGTGLKEIWECGSCGLQRVYGSPVPEKGATR